MRVKWIAILSVSATLAVISGFLFTLLRHTDRQGISPDKTVTVRFSHGGEPYWQITAGPANAWLLPFGDGFFLIDTGYPGDYSRFRKGMEHAGLDYSKIRFLFVTHAHDEHAGFAACLRRETGCRLVLPRESLPGLASGRFDWKGVSVNPLMELLGRLYGFVKQRDYSFEPVLPSEDDILLDAGNQDILRTYGISGTFIATPGHSHDSWSFIMDDGRAYVGDAAMNWFNFLGAGNRPIFMEDRRAMYRSLDLIRATGAQWLLTGHGDPLPVAGLPVYRESAPVGPGLSALIRYFLLLCPGLLLMGVLAFMFRKSSRSFRIWFYILGFILVRDLMTPLGFWSLGTDPVLWIRFAADGPLLLLMAGGSLVMSLALLWAEKGKGEALLWFRGSPGWSIPVGAGGALLAAGPVLLLSMGIPGGERGGVFPFQLLPALLSVTLAGNLLEELLFRGYLQPELEQQGLKPVTAAVSSGLIFGFCHLFLAFTVTSAGLSLVLYAVWEGIICGLIRWRFGLLSAVLTHGLAVALIALF